MALSDPSEQGLGYSAPPAPAGTGGETPMEKAIRESIEAAGGGGGAAPANAPSSYAGSADIGAYRAEDGRYHVYSLATGADIYPPMSQAEFEGYLEGRKNNGDPLPKATPGGPAATSSGGGGRSAAVAANPGGRYIQYYDESGRWIQEDTVDGSIQILANAPPQPKPEVPPPPPDISVKDIQNADGTWTIWRLNPDGTRTAIQTYGTAKPVAQPNFSSGGGGGGGGSGGGSGGGMSAIYDMQRAQREQTAAANAERRADQALAMQAARDAAQLAEQKAARRQQLISQFANVASTADPLAQSIMLSGVQNLGDVTEQNQGTIDAAIQQGRNALSRAALLPGAMALDELRGLTPPTNGAPGGAPTPPGGTPPGAAPSPGSWAGDPRWAPVPAGGRPGRIGYRPPGSPSAHGVGGAPFQPGSGANAFGMIPPETLARMMPGYTPAVPVDPNAPPPPSDWAVRNGYQNDAGMAPAAMNAFGVQQVQVDRANGYVPDGNGGLVPAPGSLDANGMFVGRGNGVVAPPNQDDFMAPISVAGGPTPLVNPNPVVVPRTTVNVAGGNALPTQALARGGMTRANAFITGDPQVPGRPNPEVIQNPTGAPISVVPMNAMRQQMNAFMMPRGMAGGAGMGLSAPPADPQPGGWPQDGAWAYPWPDQQPQQVPGAGRPWQNPMPQMMARMPRFALGTDPYATLRSLTSNPAGMFSNSALGAFARPAATAPAPPPVAPPPVAPPPAAPAPTSGGTGPVMGLPVMPPPVITPPAPAVPQLAPGAPNTTGGLPGAGANATDQSILDILNARQNTVGPNLNAFSIGWDQIDPDTRNAFLMARQSKYGVSKDSQQFEINNYRIPRQTVRMSS